MALSYSRTPGTSFENAVPLARDGERTIFYGDEPLDVLRDGDLEEAEYLVADLLSDTAKDLRLVDMGLKKLCMVHTDIMAKDPPRDRHGKRLHSAVKDRLGALESKYYAGDDLAVVPRCVEGQRDAYYVFGSSGSGKSTWAARFAQEYLRAHPGGRVVLISCKKNDPAFDRHVPGLERVPLDMNFIRECLPTDERLPVERYANSLVIFDDCEQVSDSALRKALLDFKKDILTLGRQFGIDVVSIQHKGLGGAKSLTELCEATGIVCFPRMNLGESKRLVAKYLSFEPSQMDRIFDEGGRLVRWMALVRPNAVVTPRYVKIID